MAKSNFNQASKFYLKVITIELQISLNLNNGCVNSGMKLEGDKTTERTETRSFQSQHVIKIHVHPDGHVQILAPSIGRMLLSPPGWAQVRGVAKSMS